MGPATVEVFRQEGAEVIADDRDLRADGAVEALVDEAGQIDVLVANLAPDLEFGIACIEIKESDFRQMFETLVYPLHRLCQAILPSMYARKQGKVIVYGSALGLRAFEGSAAYGAARTAQANFFVGQSFPFAGGWKE